MTLKIDMSNLKATKIARLQKLIAKGKWYFVIVYGVFGWGISTALLVTLIQTYLSSSSFIDKISTALIIYPVSGLAFGLVLWMMANNQYNKLVSDENEL